ncbi:MAG: hypothetical protein AAB577_00405 [Patescibacteria group bacterium]
MKKRWGVIPLIACILAGVIFLFYGRTPSPTLEPTLNQTTPVVINVPTPTPTPTTTGVIEITAEQLAKQLLANPDKYKKGTVFQVSGVLVWNWKTDSPQTQETIFFFGPPAYVDEDPLGVRVRINWGEKETIKAFRALNDKDQVVFKGTYYFFSTRSGALFENVSLISVTPAK